MHYLQHNKARVPQLGRFLELLDAGKSVDDAFGEAFEMPFSALEQELRTYIRDDSFTYYTADLSDLAIPTLPEPAAMPHDAVLQQLGRLLAQTRPENATVAQQFFEASIAANEKNAEAHASLAWLYDATGRTAEAKAAYEKALEIGSDNAEVYVHAGRYILRGSGDNPAKARPLFQRATELDPGSSGAWAGLGATYVGQTGGFAPGLAALRKSLELDPRNEETAFYTVVLFAADGRIDGARKLGQSLLARTRDAKRKGIVSELLAKLDDEESAKASADQALAWLSEAVDKASAGKIKEAVALIDAALPGLSDDSVRNEALALRNKLAGAAPRRR
jgi:tetratricopeptide (TPR) repeat protein